MFLAVLSGFAAGVIAPWVYRASGRAAGWLLALVPFGLALYFVGFIAAAKSGGVFSFVYYWAPSLGIKFSFFLDGLSLLFAILISAVGALVLVYSGGYLAGHPGLGRFYAYLLMFMASMLGLVLADNVIALYVFWELTGISSYFLIGFDHHRESARAAALQALLVTSAGGLALLAGVLLLGQAGGSLEISTLLKNGELVRSNALYLPILLLVLAGAFTKSAQVPFHFWLPSAMEAPTPVSAYLHSATMVMAGVYLLARLSPVLGGTELWVYTLSAVGAVTMITGAYLALRQTDLKRMLAYLTVSALGMLILFIGIGTTQAIAAAMVFLLAHALYKGALFLVAGIIDHETGMRDVNNLGGLRSAMPITAAAAVLAALSLAALPPTLGFVGKEMLLGASLEANESLIIPIALVVAAIVYVATAGIVAIRLFFGMKLPTSIPPHEAAPSLWLGPALLAALGVVFAVMPSLLEESLLRPAVQAIAREPVALHLTLWHGFNLPLALSALSVAGGLAIYARLDLVLYALSRLEITSWWGPQNWYSLLLTGMNVVAQRQTQLLQSGYLRYYLMIIIVTTLALAGSKLFSAVDAARFTASFDAWFHEWVIAGLIVMAAFTATVARSRLAAVAALGVVGYGVALVFVLFGAADLAMTQFMIETLTVILFVLVFSHLPRFAILSARLGLARDAVLALALGGLITTIVLIGSGIQLYPKISDYFIENSVALGHGRNIVNVILVDFRGFDTFGEITVLAVAGIGVYALLKLKLGRKANR
ncbi:MAG: putative monovalent cation/H+ antiporter subunit A [Candidatus Binatia bacterium]